MKNPQWQRDELILALDLYFQHNPSHITHTHPEIIKLSEILNALPIHENHPMQNFRNSNGVYMKLCNFLRLDPDYNGTGLDQGSKKDVEVWEDFSSNRGYLHQVAQSIKSGYKDLQSGQQYSHNEIEEAVPEGKILYRLHQTRERNVSIVKKVKERAIKNSGRLKCEVCSFDFFEVYGRIGEGFIECHHSRPISQYNSEEQTKASDLRLVCSNCHRILHKARPWITVEELKDILNRNRNL